MGESTFEHFLPLPGEAAFARDLFPLGAEAAFPFFVFFALGAIEMCAPPFVGGVHYVTDTRCTRWRIL